MKPFFQRDHRIWNSLNPTGHHRILSVALAVVLILSNLSPALQLDAQAQAQQPPISVSATQTDPAPPKLPIEDGAPEDGAPEDTPPEDGAPEDTPPEDGAPENGAPEDGAPENTPPEDTPPENGAPENSLPEDGLVNGDPPEADSLPAPRDLTDETDLLTLSVPSVGWIDAQGDSTTLDADDAGGFDLSQIPAAELTGLSLRLSFRFDGTAVQAGDYFTATLDEELFEPIDETGELTDKADAVIATYEWTDHTLTVTLLDEAVQEGEVVGRYTLAANLRPDIFEQQPREIAIPLQDGASLLFTLPAKAPAFTMNRTEEPTDWTDEIDQTDLLIFKLSYQDQNGNYKDIPQTDGQFNFTGISFEQMTHKGVQSLRLNLVFDILKDDAERKVKPGDYFLFELPTEFFKIDPIDSPQVIAFNGVPIANYTIRKQDPGTLYTDKEVMQLKAVFTDNVNPEIGYRKIKGGMNLDFTLNPEAFKNPGGGSVPVELVVGKDKITIPFPAPSNVVKGLSKTGKFDSASGSVIWTVEVGKDSPGVQIGGLKLIDTFPDADFAPLEDPFKKEVDGSYFYTFPADAKTPQTLTITTKLNSDVLDGNVDKSFTNTVHLDAAASGHNIADAAPATATVPVAKPKMTKEGTQLTSNKAGWTLVANPEKHTLENVVITDTLTNNLTFDTDSLGITVDGAPFTAYTTEYTGNTLKIAIPTLTGEAKITFTTSIGNELLDPDPSGNPPPLTNTATMTYKWPGGIGGGDFTPPIASIGSGFNTAFINKSGSGDPKTGIVTWTITPSTRRPSFTEAVVTDTINTDQELVTGSIEVKKGNSTMTSGQATDGLTYTLTQATTPLTFTFTKDASNTTATLNDVTITYKTKSLDFFKTNNTNVIVSNTANLSVLDGATTYKDDDTAIVTLKNEFLNKSAKYEYVSGLGQVMHFTIPVNKNGLTLNNVVVEDDLAALSTSVTANNSITINPTDWLLVKHEVITTGTSEVTSITPTISTSPSANQTVTVTWAHMTKPHTIHLYLRLTDDARDKAFGAGNSTLKVTNTVTGTSDQVKPGNDPFSVETTGDAAGTAGNTTLSKTAAPVNKVDGVPGIDWTLTINPNAANLTGAKLVDTIPAGLEFDLSSVELYQKAAGVPGEGSLVTPAPATTLAFAGDKTTMTVSLPDGAHAYTLKYRTNIVGEIANGKAENEAKLVVGGNEIGAGNASATVGSDDWGYLESMAALRILKYDQAEGGSPLPGATFGLYADENATQLLKQGVTDQDGRLTFYALKVNHDYWYKEITAPPGYTLDTAIYKFNHEQGVTTKPNANRRTSPTATITLQKQFVGSVDAAKTAEFQLYLYTTHDVDAVTLTGPRKPVKLTEVTPGNFKYDGMDAGAITATAPTGDNQTAEIKITGLPWGVYALEESDPANGYAAYTQKTVGFAIKQNGDVTYSPAITGQNNTITNNLTELTIRKVGDNNTLIDGATLEIRKNKTDTTPVKTTTGETLQWTTSNANNPKTITGLPVGSYYLVETAAPGGNETLALADPIPFTLDMYGELTVGGDKATNTVTMVDATIKLNVQKRDQFNKSVSGATLQLVDSAAPSNVIPSTTTGADGNLTFTGLLRGHSYTLSETATPAGHIVAKPITFTVDEYGKISVTNLGTTTDEDYQNKLVDDHTLLLRDERIVGHASFKKTDSASGEPLVGIKFGLYKADDTLVSNALVSDADGLVTTLGKNLGADGRDGLDPGDYYFKELPDQPTHGDFIVNDTQLAFTIDEANRYTLPGEKIVTTNPETLTNTPLNAAVKLKKIDAENSAPLIGAAFTLKRDGGGFTPQKRTSAAAGTVEFTDSNGNKKAYTTADGEVWFGALPRGTYTLTETKAPTGYTLGTPAFSCQFTITDASNTVLEIKDGETGFTVTDPNSLLTADGLKNERAKGKVTLTKKNESNAPLAGVEFTLKSHPDNSETKVTSDSDGKVTFTDLAWGSYTLTESKPLDGYIQEAWSQTFPIDATHLTKDFGIITNKTAKLMLEKHDSVSNQLLPGAKFTLAGTFATAGSPKTIDASTDGKAELRGQLIVGNSYTLTETETPKGYFAAAPITFTYQADGSLSLAGGGTVAYNTPLIVHNTPTTFTLEKRCADCDRPLEGATFTLAGSFADGSSPKTIDLSTTSSETLTGQLLPGETYTLTETTAPTGYTALTEEITFTVDAQGWLTLTSNPDSAASLQGQKLLVANDPELTLRLTKTDANGAPLTGATFELTGTFLDGSPTQTLTLDQSHTLAVCALLLDGESYTLTELTAPSGYRMLDAPIRFQKTGTTATLLENPSESATLTLSPDGSELSLTVKNQRIPSSGGGGGGGGGNGPIFSSTAKPSSSSSSSGSSSIPGATGLPDSSSSQPWQDRTPVRTLPTDNMDTEELRRLLDDGWTPLGDVGNRIGEDLLHFILDQQIPLGMFIPSTGDGTGRLASTLALLSGCIILATLLPRKKRDEDA